MGLEKSSGSGSYKTFLEVNNGKLQVSWNSKPTQKDLPNSLSGINLEKDLQSRVITKGKNEGNTKWFVEFNSVSGYLLNVERIVTSYGAAQIQLNLIDDGEIFVLQIDEDSGYGRNFMYKMNNIDVTKKLIFSPFSFEDKEGKKRMGVSVYEGERVSGEGVSSYYTKDDPKGLPSAEEVVVKGEKKWDFTKVENFLYEELMKWIEATNKKISGASQLVSETEKSTSEKSDKSNQSSPINLDDIELPF